jgi:hypothetical protein
LLAEPEPKRRKIGFTANLDSEKGKFFKVLKETVYEK